MAPDAGGCSNNACLPNILSVSVRKDVASVVAESDSDTPGVDSGAPPLSVVTTSENKGKGKSLPHLLNFARTGFLWPPPGATVWNRRWYSGKGGKENRLPHSLNFARAGFLWLPPGATVWTRRWDSEIPEMGTDNAIFANS